MTTATEELPVISQVEASVIKSFGTTRKIVDEMVVANSELEFDYETKKGNAAARSHRGKLKTMRADIERCRVSEKQEALSYGRLVDSTAKELTGKVSGMIDVIDKPIKAIEERDAKHEQILSELVLREDLALAESDSLANQRDEISGIDTLGVGNLESAKAAALAKIDDIYMPAAKKRADDAKQLADLEQKEADRIEADRIKAEEEAQAKAEAKRQAEAKAEADRVEAARVERERIVAEEAAAQAKKDAEAKAEADRIAREDKIRQEKEEADRLLAKSEQEKEEAKLEAERLRKEAKEAEEKRIADAKAETERLERVRIAAVAEAKEKAKREAEAAKLKAADRETKISRGVTEMAALFGWTAEQATPIVTAIADGKMPSIKLV